MLIDTYYVITAVLMYFVFIYVTVTYVAFIKI